MMVTNAKVRNASRNTGSRCRSGRNCGWLQPTRAFGVVAVYRISLLVLAFVGLGFATSPADAAIAVDNVTSIQIPSTSANPSTFSHTTSGSDRLLLVSIASQPNDDDGIVEVVTGITYGGQALTVVGTEAQGPDNARVEIWQLVNPPTGSNTVAITFNDAFDDPVNEEGASAGAVSFTGVHQATPLGTFVSATNSCPSCSEVPTVNVSSAAGELVFDTIARKANAVSVGPGQTEQWHLCTDGGCSNVDGGASTEPGAASVTMSWTPTNDRWAIGAIPIRPATGALVAHWTFDEGSGQTAADSSGNGHNGTLGSTIGVDADDPTWTCIVGGNALTFDGSDDWVNAGDIDAIDGATKLTVTAWVKSADISANKTIIRKHDGVNTWQFRQGQAPGSGLRVSMGGQIPDGVTANGLLSAGVWGHWTMVFDGAGATNDDRLKIYLDGIDRGPLTFANGPIPAAIPDNGTAVVEIGQHEFFNGVIDDMRIYDRVLSPAEISTLAASPPTDCDIKLVKRAFWPDGTPIPTGATIPSGVELKYLLYINNPGPALSDVTVRDVLDPVFLYQSGTIQVDNSVAECALAICTAADELAIFTTVDSTPFLSDALDGDVASYTGASSSVDAGNGNMGNLQLDINADAVWAILFSVKMP